MTAKRSVKTGARKQNLLRRAHSVRRLAVIPRQHGSGKVTQDPHSTVTARGFRPSAVPVVERAPAWLDKILQPRFEQDAAPILLLAGTQWDRNDDGIIDPMEHALGRIHMTMAGDVGLRETEMLDQRMKRREVTKGALLADSGHGTAPEPRVVRPQRSSKPQPQKPYPASTRPVR